MILWLFYGYHKIGKLLQLAAGTMDPPLQSLILAPAPKVTAQEATSSLD